MIVGFTGLCLSKVFFFLLNNVFSLISKVQSSLKYMWAISQAHTHTRAYKADKIY